MGSTNTLGCAKCLNADGFSGEAQLDRAGCPTHSRFSNAWGSQVGGLSAAPANTGVDAKFAVRVDVTDKFPFLVTKLSPYFDR